ncbi:hypothetical protein ABPG73_008248 [Tetrahymena malaccensis]
MKGVKSKAQIAPLDHSEIQNLKGEIRITKNNDGHSKEKQFSFLQQNQMLNQMYLQKLNVLNKEKGHHLQKKSTNYNSISQEQTKRFHYIHLFTQKIKQYSSYYKFTQIKKRFLQIIDDYAFDYDVYFYQRIFQNEQPTRLQIIFQKIETWLARQITTLDPKSGAIMLPSSYVNTVWNLFQFILLLLYIVYLPIRLSFDSLHRQKGYFTIFEVFPNIIQILSMFFEFNTGFYKHGQIILDRWEICVNYFKSRFAFDLALNICWLVSLNPDISIWAKCIGLFRVISLIRLLKELEQTNSLRERYGNLFELLKLSSFIFLCAHLASCCWYALAIYEDDMDVQNTWLKKDISNYELDLNVNLKLQGYIAAMYYCIVTMTTIGFGDVTPITYRERIFTLIFCMLSCFLFAFTMGSIAEIVKQFSLKGEEFKQKMQMLNLYMKKRNLSQNLQVRVRKFYENQNQESSENNEYGSKLIESLTPELREDVQKDIYSFLFKNIGFFQINFSERFIQNIYRIVEEKQFQIDEKILEEGQKPDKLYVIIKGQVQLLLQNRHCLITKKEGEVLGLPEFFSQQSYQFSAKASRNTQLAVIKYDDFIKLAAEHQHDYEIYCQIKDTTLLNNHQSMIQGIICECCGQTDHIFQNCQMIILNQNQKKNAVQQNKRKQITRQEWLRKTQSYQALVNRQLIEIRAIEQTEDAEQGKKTDTDFIHPQQSVNNISLKSLNALRMKEYEFIEEEDEQKLEVEIGKAKQIDNLRDDSKMGEEVEDCIFIDKNNDKMQKDNQEMVFQFQSRKIQKNVIKLANIPQTQQMIYPKTLEEINQDFQINNLYSNQKVQYLTAHRKNSINLTLKTSKQQHKRNSFGSYFVKQQTLDDLKRQINEELQKNKQQPTTIQKTVISALNEQEYVENYNFEMKFDSMNSFKYYLVHNNYEKVLNQFNQIIEKNKIYQELLLKSLKRKRQQSEQTKENAYKQKRQTLRRIPTSQKFYLMKQRNTKISLDQSCLISYYQETTQRSNIE